MGNYLQKLTQYISPGNDKTGEEFSFDLPAKITCPGMTPSCGDKCYAASLMRIYKNVDAKYQRNLAFANTDDFVPYMLTAIPYGTGFRIHVSGDFYSEAYIAKWVQIATARTDVHFYAYTRSWRDPILWAAIQKLQALPNVNVNISCDDDTGMPDCENAAEYRWAFLTHDKGSNGPDWLRRSDIVFRSNSKGHKTRRKNALKKGLDPNVVAPLVNRFGAAPVCPFERGRELSSFSCSQCGICLKKPSQVQTGVV